MGRRASAEPSLTCSASTDPSSSLISLSTWTGLRAHRDRRKRIVEDRAQLIQILRAGNAKAEAVADKTLAEVRQAMSMDY